nr:hypothetical protein [uncultured Allomuricauda sp.]
MGRKSTGAYSTNRCRKLDLTWMVKTGIITRGAVTTGKMSWSDGSEVLYVSKFTEDDKFVRLNYIFSNGDGPGVELDYKIFIVGIPSNLGKGTVYYFECPESGKRARILYQAYGHNKYLHRDWYFQRYNKRIYYGCQISSKLDYHNDRFHELDRRVSNLEKELNQKHRKRTYKGKYTSGFQKLNKLKNKKWWHDDKRTQVLAYRLGMLW